jgi:hypothetical protein
MAKVLFSITDAQLACLEQLRAGAEVPAQADKRTLTGLRRRKLTVEESGRDVLTAQGLAVLDLCEKLAIRSHPSNRERA